MRHTLTKCAAGLAVLGMALGGASCTDLTETPYTEITEANFKPTAADLAALMAPAYTPLRNIWMSWYGMVDFQEETADHLLTPVRPNGWYDGGVYIRLHEHRWDANQGQPNGMYGQAFNGINAANRVIYQIESGVIPVDAATKTATLAELRAVRAYYYSILLDNFGNVPIVTDFTSTDLPEQATRKQVYDFVVKELTETTPQLSAATGSAIYGRINQLTAKGILARVYLNAEVYTGTAAWDKVLTLTQEVIASGKFRLDDTYRGPFARTNQNSPEIVFAVPYDQVNANQSNFHMKTLKPDLRFALGLSAQPWGGSASNPQFIDTYDKDDGRLADTWLMGTVKDAQGRVDYPALRYAEILMMRAEALLRTGQADQAATLVTQVRQRNFKGAAASKATVTGAQLQQGSAYNYGWYDSDGVVKDKAGGTRVTNGGADIKFGRFLDELGWEFAIEAHRRTDLIRFGVFTTKTWFNHTPNGAYRTIFAIPQNAINTNGKLKQNPGY
jgi:starch-binding outer membrane protein, SusD/RagB family